MKITRGVDDFMPFTVTFDRREELALLAGLVGDSSVGSRSKLLGADWVAAEDFHNLYVAAQKHLGRIED